MFWILKGALAFSARPRSAAEVESFDLVICLLEDCEIRELGLDWLQALRLPVADRGCPPDRLALNRALDCAESTLSRGGQVLIHCRAGIGRSALVSACLLARMGQAQRVWARLSQLRGVSVPDTEEQKEWFEQFARGLHAPNTLEEALRRVLNSGA